MSRVPTIASPDPAEANGRIARAERLAPTSKLTQAAKLIQIRFGERLLGETFGADYGAYRARTWRLVPYL